MSISVSLNCATFLVKSPKNIPAFIHLTIFFADPSVLAATLRGHNDAVWSLAYNTSRQQLLSASSDGTVKLWSPVNKTQSLLRSFEREAAMPTSVDWVKDDQSHMVAAYTNADCVIYDIETGNPVIKLDTMSVSILMVLWGTEVGGGGRVLGRSLANGRCLHQRRLRYLRYPVIKLDTRPCR